MRIGLTSTYSLTWMAFMVGNGLEGIGVDYVEEGDVIDGVSKIGCLGCIKTLLKTASFQVAPNTERSSEDEV